MKNASLIMNAVLSVAVVVLFILHFTSKPAATDNTNQSAENGIIASRGDIVFLQLDSLVNNYDMFNDLSSELESKAQGIQDDISKKGRALENDAKDFQQKIQKGLLTRAAAESQQQTLAVREQELNMLIQQRQGEMAEEEAVLYRRILDAVKTYLEQMNRETGYAMIINTSGSTNNVLQGDPGLDITNVVIKGLNEEYVSQKKSK